MRAVVVASGIGIPESRPPVEAAAVVVDRAGLMGWNRELGFLLAEKHSMSCQAASFCGSRRCLAFLG